LKESLFFVYTPLAVAHPSLSPCLKLGLFTGADTLELVHAVNKSAMIVTSNMLITLFIISPVLIV
jgi:hypothetical protein